MSSRDGFQPCIMDTGTPAPMPHWERNLVIVALGVHVLDVGLDLCVALLFLAHAQWAFLIGVGGVIIWAWLVSSLYISFGGGAPAGDIDHDTGVAERLPSFFLNFVQVQIFAEAYSCIWHNGDTDYFHTLRLMEAILESAPNSLVQLYALVIWALPGGVETEAATALLQGSVLSSFVSVGLGLAMWEQKVQFRTSAGYVATVAVMRTFEIAARSATLAVFSGLTHPYGFFWSLAADYGIMLFLIVRHQSVQFTYGLFVALPLVLVSLEPLVWRREDHAVPKDSYYLVRVAEFVVMWTVIIHRQSTDDAEAVESSVLGCEVLALVSMLGLFVTLPFVWRTARQYELCRDVADWADEDDGSKEAMNEDAYYSESDGSSGGYERGRGEEELPPE